MTQILGFVGKKQSGKNTSCNFIIAIKLAELTVCNVARINADGEIEVSDVLGEKGSKEWLLFKSPEVSVDELYDNELGKFVRVYAIADSLKQMAVDILGLSKEQAFGSDKDKNSKTKLKWENMPGVISPSDLKKKGFTQEQVASLGMMVHRKGVMTAREVLQYVGTDMFRKMNSDVWLDSLFRRIKKDNAELALVSDVRFENEVQSIKDQEGFVIGLTRSPYGSSDEHSSESEVTSAIQMCSAVIENEGMDLSQQNQSIYAAVKHLDGVIPQIEE